MRVILDRVRFVVELRRSACNSLACSAGAIMPLLLDGPIRPATAGP